MSMNPYMEVVYIFWTDEIRPFGLSLWVYYPPTMPTDREKINADVGGRASTKGANHIARQERIWLYRAMIRRRLGKWWGEEGGELYYLQIYSIVHRLVCYNVRYD